MHEWIANTPSGPVFHSAIDTPLGRITWAGRHLEQTVSQPMAMRYWDTYAAVFMLKGRARFYDEAGLDLPFGAGDLLLTFPRHGYRYEIAADEPWSEFFIQFRGPLFTLWLKEGLINPKRPIHRLEPIAHWWQRLEAIIKPLSLPEPAQSLKRICQLQDFLVDAIITPQTEAVPNDVRWLAAVRAELDRDFSRPIDWAALARQFDLSYHRFRKKFTVLGGVSPGAYRAAKVIEHAGALLHNRDLSLREIARRCGFYDACYFAKRFKAINGVTPAQFRHRLL